MVANFRLHGDVPLLAAHAGGSAAGGGAPRVEHVSVTYTPGTPGMYTGALLSGARAAGEREGFAVYLVSNCGRPRDLLVARLIDILGPDRRAPPPPPPQASV